MKPYLFCIFILCLCLRLSSQDLRIVDSLERDWKSHRASRIEWSDHVESSFDTTEADILFALSKAYWGNTPDKAMDFANQALELSDKIGYTKGKANGYNALGVIYFQRGDYTLALENYDKSLQYRIKSGDQRGEGNIYNNVGEVYRIQGNYPEALRYHFLALRKRVEIKDSAGIGRSYNNIGLVYMNQGNRADALENYLAALTIAEEINDKQSLVALYNNIGIIRYEERDWPAALKNHEASLAMAIETGNKQSQASNYINIGNIYQHMQRYPEALDHYETSRRIAHELQDQESLANICYNIGRIYTRLGKPHEAMSQLQKALYISKKYGLLEGIMNSYYGRASLDSLMGNYESALVHYRQYVFYKDSLHNVDIYRKTIQQKMQFDFDKQQALREADQEKKDALVLEKFQNQKMIRNVFIGGFSLVLLFAGILLLQRNKISQEKWVSEVERQKSEIAKKRSDELLLNILPQEIADELKFTGFAKPRSYTMVTVMFTDFKDFTRISERVSAELMVAEINACFSAFDQIVEKYNIEKIKTIGDAYLCAAGLPVPNFTHADDMVHAALEIREFVHNRKREKEARGEIGFEIRIGIHTGPLVAGVVGLRKYAYDIWGDTVNLAARLEQNSDVGKINISGSTYELVKDKYPCAYRGRIQAKNKGNVEMYFVESPNRNHADTSQRCSLTEKVVSH